MSPVTIRPATSEDRAWILPLSSRLHDFGPPPFRPRERMDAAVAGWIGQAFESPGDDRIVLVAEDEHRRPVGFIYVHEAADFFTGETHGHVSDVVVAEGAEGGGVGRMLMAAGEEWSRARGHRLLTLNVFEKNVRARTLYEILGFESDTSKMVKVLRR
ncbi:MAG: GNAT family N-acetyltransferase [Acidobacteriota bacterium]|nr:GNAT family N-acetyltransferase [Acidobacteriota bacterium]